MDRLSNAFSVLEIDVDDHHPPSASSSSGNGKSNGKGSADAASAVVKKQSELSSALLSEGYKLPLVWIDLEMTGLDIEVDRILEIACIITDGNLNKSIEGPDLVIHQSKECLDRMGEWCQEHHAASGLTKKVLQSKISEREAEKQVIDFVKKHVVVDVSSVRALCIRWYPKDQKKAPVKENKHRAMDDIRESILELKYFKETIFKGKSKR
ncbi:Exonuclease [Corchorus olitorius]|uniref:Exonuclease n=1 Tax=Corchorus olitorius TaxID=93759 RepID=A0A1R3J9G7_9ROSI|nr:Exonuclease [Corchorus olitorius]